MEATTNFTREQNMFIASQKLSDEELEAKIQEIILKHQEGIVPSDRPIAVIVGGQPGAGKSGVIGDTLTKLNSNCVIVDNDLYRYEHPNFAEINGTHPEIFTECTDQLSFATTPRLIDSMIEGKYNMIIHQTLKNDTIVKSAITKLLEAGYTVVVRALAVDKVTSMRDELRRGQKELAAGRIPRWVPPQNHDFAYNGLPGTVGLIEELGKYHMLEIVTRSENEDDLNAINVIYRGINPETSFERRQDLAANGFTVSKIPSYPSAEAAVYGGRQMDADKTLSTIEEDLAKMSRVSKTAEERARIKRIEDACLDYVMPYVAKKTNGDGSDVN